MLLLLIGVLTLWLLSIVVVVVVELLPLLGLEQLLTPLPTLCVTMIAFILLGAGLVLVVGLGTIPIGVGVGVDAAAGMSAPLVLVSGLPDNFVVDGPANGSTREDSLQDNDDGLLA